MNFLTPTAIAFAAAIPVVILFYLLKRRRIVRVVSSTMLWQKFLAETQASAPFQKLRHNWLLLFQILLLALAVLALTRPYFEGSSTSGRFQVVILDASASMQSTDVHPNRFEAAREKVEALINGLGREDQMVLIQSSASTRVVQSPTNEKNRLKRALASIRVTDSPTRLLEGVTLAESLAKANPSTVVHLFTDGAVPDLNEFNNPDLNMVYHRVGETHENVGVVTLDVRVHPEEPARRAVFASIVNYGSTPAPVVAELRFNDVTIDSRALTLQPGETSPQVFVADQEVNGIFGIHLNVEDALNADNQAWFVSILPEPVRIHLLSAGSNRFLEKALRAVPHAEVTLVSSPGISEDPPDVVVLNGYQPADWPAGNILAIHSTHPDWFEGVETLEAPAVVDWKSSHPLLRFVNLDNVQIARSLGVTRSSWALGLVEAPRHSLMLAGERSRQRIVWVGFDVLESTWPLQISFPIFIANAVNWLNPGSAAAEMMTIKTGTPFRIRLDSTNPDVLLARPDGTEESLARNESTGELVFADTSSQGIYRMKSGSREWFVAVNLLDTAESDITPREEIQLGQYRQVSASTDRTANIEFWRWIAAAGLGVLMFEWWYYHKRTA